jgi:hypothetical protein
MNQELLLGLLIAAVIAAVIIARIASIEQRLDGSKSIAFGQRSTAS